MLKMKVTGPRSGVLSARLMKQFEDAERAALIQVQPIMQQVLLVTLGTQYYSLRDLRRMGYPYSAQRPAPPMPPGVVNKQSGRFYDSILITSPVRIGKQIVLSVYTTDQERVDQLTNNSEMIDRPYKVLLQSRMRRQVERGLGDVLRGMIKVKVRG